MSGPEQEAKAATANTGPSTTSPHSVETYWYVDYHQLAGNYARNPYRMGDDQMVVEHLKIMPDVDGAQILHGGNAASSGQVLLGEAQIPASTGQVSAAIRYAKRASFKLDVSLDGKLTAADNKQLAAVRAEMRDKLDDMLLTRGDYEAIRTELEATYADRFPDHKLSVKLQPGGSKSSGTTFTAAAGTYDASKATKFLVTIDPGQAEKHETQYSKTTVEDRGTAVHDSSSVTSTNDTTVHDSKETVDEIVAKFEDAYRTNVQKTFSEIVEAARNASEVKESDLSHNVTWKLGLNPKQEDKQAAEKAAPAKKSGVLGKIWSGVKTATGYVLKAGGKMVKVGKALFELGGDLVGVISGRGWFARESVDGSTTRDSRTDGSANKQTDQESSITTIAEDVVTAFTSSHKEDLKSEITAHVQVSTTQGSGTDETDKTTTSKTVSGSETTHELGDLAVSVKAKG
jgi:hypothetical protein